MSKKHISRTAAKIARFIILIDAIPRLRGVLPEGAADTVERILRSCESMPARHIDMMRSASGRLLLEGAERLTGRGQVLWFGVRKRWVFESVESAIREGARQLLVLGAGMDPLAVMIAKRHPDVLCVEIDAPATANPKSKGVEGAGLTRPNHLVQAVDLGTTPLVNALQNTPWRKDVKSVIVAEGLLMYLAPSDVDALFRVLLENVGAASRFAFTTLQADEKGRIDLGPLSGLMIFFSRLAGESLRWGLHPRDVSAFLDARGWRLVEQPSIDELRQRYLVPMGASNEPLRHYDYVVVAEVR